MTKKPTKDDVVFQVTAKISNKEYTDELGNVSRAEFKILSKELAEVLTKIFDGGGLQSIRTSNTTSQRHTSIKKGLLRGLLLVSEVIMCQT